MLHEFLQVSVKGVQARCGVVGILFACLFVSHALAQVPAVSRVPPLTDGVKGLVVNQTLSGGGYEFYRVFSELWMLKPDSDNYSVSVVERPGQRYGNNFIAVFLGQTRIYSGALPRKFEQIRPLSETAVDTALANIVATALENPESGQFDIGKSEL